MTAKQIQALMVGLVILACVIGGMVLMAMGINHTVGVIMLVIAGSYLGLDLTPWVPLGKNQKKNKD
ncbi:hypothetical protein ES704_02785 [subsurface metagenome]|jgi:hypothetical protein